MKTDRVPQRIWDKIFPEPNSGCWLWTGSIAGSSHLGGYGQTYWDGANAYVHRVLYSLLKAAIPDGHDLDHKCRVRSCCNPEHLEPVTRSENNKRGTVGNNRKIEATLITNCVNGHEFTEENTLINKRTGARRCRTCKNEGSRKYRAERC